MVVVVFRARARPDIGKEYEETDARMADLAATMPGFGRHIPSIVKHSGLGESGGSPNTELPSAMWRETIRSRRDSTRMNGAICLAEPYVPRSVRCFDVQTFDGWRVKLYGIAYRGERPVQALVEAAVAAARDSLPRPAVAHDRYGVGFVGAHDGRGANFVFLDWWANEDELHHHTWLSSKEEPGRLRATGPDDFTACAWDLAVIAHERGAWIRHVLARPQGPDVDAYLADQLHANV